MPQNRPKINVVPLSLQLLQSDFLHEIIVASSNMIEEVFKNVFMILIFVLNTNKTPAGGKTLHRNLFKMKNDTRLKSVHIIMLRLQFPFFIHVCELVLCIKSIAPRKLF